MTNLWQIYANSMLEKGMQKTWKVIQNGANMGAKIKNKSIKNEVRKSMRKRGHMQDGSAACGGRLLKTKSSLLVSSSSRFRLVLVASSVSTSYCQVPKRFLMSRNAHFRFNRLLFRQLFVSAKVFQRHVTWRLVTSCSCPIFVWLKNENVYKSENVYEGLDHLMLIARSLKRPMLHTCSGVISGCEFKG